MAPQTARHVHESPVAMTGVLVILAVLSAIGGFLSVPHYLEPLLPLPSVVPELEHLETTLVFISVALALAGLIAAVFLYGGNGERAARLGSNFPLLHRVLFGKYFVDEAYDRLLTRPLYWISDRVFLRLGDQRILDGSLNGLAALGQRGAALLSRIQTGSLHLYALLVVVGIVASLAWSWRHG